MDLLLCTTAHVASKLRYMRHRNGTSTHLSAGEDFSTAWLRHKTTRGLAFTRLGHMVHKTVHAQSDYLVNWLLNITAYFASYLGTAMASLLT